MAAAMTAGDILTVRRRRSIFSLVKDHEKQSCKRHMYPATHNEGHMCPATHNEGHMYPTTHNEGHMYPTTHNEGHNTQ